MEVTGVVLSTSGLISIAQICIKAAQIIRGIKTFRDDTATLFAVYEFEYVRLNLWITQVLRISVSIDDLSHISLEDTELPTILTSDSPIDLRMPLHNALNEVKKILITVKGLLEEYGASDLSLKKRAGFKTKIYKEGGQETIQTLLKEFKDWNDRLEGVVESRLRSTLISNMQIHVLAAASTTQQLQTIEVASRSLHPDLSNQASFRQNLITIENQSSGTTLTVRADELEPCRAPREQADNLRAFGLRRKAGVPPERVLQEWKIGQLDWTATQLTEAIERAGKLAAMLHLDQKPENLRCLDLVGYALVDTAIGGSDIKRLDFCFLYKVPVFANNITEPMSLRAAMLLPSERDKPSLAERFGIALILAKSVLAFHSNNWLHKAVCSSNVIFFKDKNINRLSYTEPFLSGFEFARPDTAKDRTLDAFGGVDFDIFCHPDLIKTIQNSNSGRPRYQRQYDVYGLGVTLLEIGCWTPMTTYLRKKPKDRSNQEQFLKTCNEVLPPRMGNRYRDVVLKCFEWKPDAEKAEPGLADTEGGREGRQSQITDYMYSIVNILESCHCRD